MTSSTSGHQVPEGPGWPVHRPQAHRRREARPGLHLQEPGHRVSHRLQGKRSFYEFEIT